MGDDQSRTFEVEILDLQNPFPMRIKFKTSKPAGGKMLLDAGPKQQFSS